MRPNACREVTVDSSFTVKPRDTISRTGIGRSAVARTELAPSQSVSAPRATVAPNMLVTESTGREPVINPQAQALLSREQEERQRRAREAADEALLRRRAYGTLQQPQPAHRAPKGEDEGEDPHADIEA
jgi:hypothetical protein